MGSVAIKSVGWRFLLVALLVAACTSSSERILEIPAAGEVAAAYADDGDPVFVVHDLDGSVHVVEAISTHLEDEPIAWCPSSRTFDDIFHGSIWDPWGRYVAGPAPKDLGTYDYEVVEGKSELKVTNYVEPQERSIESAGVEGPRCPDNGVYQVHPYFND